MIGHEADRIGRLPGQPDVDFPMYSRNNKGVKKPYINFKGLMVGNAVTADYYHDQVGTFESCTITEQSISAGTSVPGQVQTDTNSQKTL
ncbi:hypothetical protein BAE44_0016105 [Dichanthelium oligosanthes]|uniref:Uncharacterized protein n=1 Tax=Dichanthelium oligosanthes TaxID=888268 RepID=A0A1E5VCJ7_9POAL|nr:hypothetical protein BAE44_0016105 [Dichanthelium oligosanthes]